MLPYKRRSSGNSSRRAMCGSRKNIFSNSPLATSAANSSSSSSSSRRLASAMQPKARATCCAIRDCGSGRQEGAGSKPGPIASISVEHRPCPRLVLMRGGPEGSSSNSRDALREKKTSPTITSPSSTQPGSVFHASPSCRSLSEHRGSRTRRTSDTTERERLGRPGPRTAPDTPKRHGRV